MTLASPPVPLHSELSAQVSSVGPAEVALHLAPVSQRRLQPAMLQVVLQSVPAEQAQLFSGLQVQPAPVQVAGPARRRWWSRPSRPGGPGWQGTFALIS
jgi:hypothetical protein